MTGLLRSGVKQAVVLALSTLLLLAVGCSGKVTAENYAKLKVGMGYDEVVAILNNPDRSEEQMKFKTCTWGKAGQSITVRFLADRAVFFSKEGLR